METEYSKLTYGTSSRGEDRISKTVGVNSVTKITGVDTNGFAHFVKDGETHLVKAPYMEFIQ